MKGNYKQIEVNKQRIEFVKLNKDKMSPKELATALDVGLNTIYGYLQKIDGTGRFSGKGKREYKSKDESIYTNRVHNSRFLRDNYNGWF